MTRDIFGFFITFFSMIENFYNDINFLKAQPVIGNFQDKPSILFI